MKKSPIFFFIILIILTIFLIWVIYYHEQGKNTGVNTEKTLENITNQQSQFDLIARYKEGLRKTFEGFMSANNLVIDPALTNQSLQELEQDIIGLIVPTEYKELHLDIVIAINKLKGFDPEEIKESQRILEEQINIHQWLSPFLPAFILNYY